MVLHDLYERMLKARQTLRQMATDSEPGPSAARLFAKAEGVDLAASYVAEAMRGGDVSDA